ncbi:MAG TPA: DUF4337 family protein [Candidatus Tumulicola sp.]|nr:DUF4337 family protein [Candidatus Tumulicola sp.]
MSESMQRTMSEAQELQETGARGNRVVAVAVAVVAVLAALGTLFTHHRSIAALTAKNEAILSQARASDAYGKYDAKQVRYQVSMVLLQSGLPSGGDARKTLEALAERERDSSVALLAKAQALEAASEEDDVRSEKIFKSYETLQFATTFFEISIVLVSISTLVRARWFLAVGGTLSAIGIALLIFGLSQGG